MECVMSGPTHIVMSVEKVPRTAASVLFEVVEVDLDLLRGTIEQIYLDRSILPSEDEWRVVARARADATRRDCPLVDTDDVALAALELAGPIIRLAFERLNISLDDTLRRANRHFEDMIRLGREHLQRSLDVRDK